MDYHTRAGNIPLNPMPYTVDYRANAHVNVHHEAGYKLVGDAFFDPIFDGFLDAFAKGYEALKIEFGSWGHYAFVVCAEACICAAGVELLWGHLQGGRVLVDAVCSQPTVCGGGGWEGPGT